LPTNAVPFSQNPIFQWTRQGGSTGYDGGRGIASDGLGNIFVTGDFSNTATFSDTSLISTGSEEVFVAKYDGGGTLLWIRQIGGTGFDRANGIATDINNNCIIIGRFEGTAIFGDTAIFSIGGEDIFIAKYDSDGNLLWVEQAGGSGNDRGNHIETDNYGNIVCTGRFETSASFGDTTIVSAGSEDIFIAKYDSNGDMLWVHQAGGTGIDRGHGIDIDDLDNIITTGRFEFSASIGDSIFNSTGLWDIFIVAYDADGHFLWARKAGGTYDDGGFSIGTDNLGYIYITGQFEDEASFGDTSLVAASSMEDIFVAKYNNNGDLLWATAAGGVHWDRGWGINVTGSGSCYVTGRFRNTATFGDTILTSTGLDDIFVARYDSEGILSWIWQAGGTGDDWGFSINSDNFNNIFITGRFTLDATFGDTTLSSVGSYDMFVTKIEDHILSLSKGEIYLPNGFQLLQNYPNPFNPTTTIEFSLPKTEIVTLEVYNILGEELATLVSERLTAGKYKYDWDASSLASGVYFYQLQAGSFMETKKMLLLR